MNDSTVSTTSDFSSTSSMFGVFLETSTVPQVSVSSKKGHQIGPSKEVVNAVYSHIRAVRTLGRKSVNTAEIADALNLSPSEVRSAVRELAAKGVKVQKK